MGTGSLVWGIAFAWNVDFTGWRYFRAESRIAVVDYCERTTHRVGGRRNRSDSGTPIFRLYFSFVDSASGTKHSGFSYQTGRCLPLRGEVRIEHPKRRPDLARIVGLRARPYSAWYALLLVLPAAGLALAAVSLRMALADRRKAMEGRKR
jgi:hypothetical protein